LLKIGLKNYVINETLTWKIGIILFSFLTIKMFQRQDAVTQAYNPSYLGGREGRQWFKASWAKSSWASTNGPHLTCAGKHKCQAYFEIPSQK
jgi:hypothetical protein